MDDPVAEFLAREDGALDDFEAIPAADNEAPAANAAQNGAYTFFKR